MMLWTRLLLYRPTIIGLGSDRELLIIGSYYYNWKNWNRVFSDPPDSF